MFDRVFWTEDGQEDVFAEVSLTWRRHDVWQAGMMRYAHRVVVLNTGLVPPPGCESVHQALFQGLQRVLLCVRADRVWQDVQHVRRVSQPRPHPASSGARVRHCRGEGAHA